MELEGSVGSYHPWKAEVGWSVIGCRYVLESEAISILGKYVSWLPNGRFILRYDMVCGDIFSVISQPQSPTESDGIKQIADGRVNPLSDVWTMQSPVFRLDAWKAQLTSRELLRLWSVNINLKVSRQAQRYVGNK